MNTITFKNTEYTVTTNHPVHPVLAADGLKSQMTITGKRGAAYLLQVWETQFGMLYKRIDTDGRLAVELKK